MVDYNNIFGKDEIVKEHIQAIERGKELLKYTDYSIGGARQLEVIDKVPDTSKVVMLPTIYQLFHKKPPIDYIEELASREYIAKQIERKLEELNMLKNDLLDYLEEIARRKQELYKLYKAGIITREEFISLQNAYITIATGVAMRLKAIFNEIKQLKRTGGLFERIGKIYYNFLWIWKSDAHFIKFGIFTEQEAVLVRRLYLLTTKLLSIGISYGFDDLIEFVVNVVYPQLNAVVFTALARGGAFLRLMGTFPWQPIEYTPPQPPSPDALLSSLKEEMFGSGLPQEQQNPSNEEQPKEEKK